MEKKLEWELWASETIQMGDAYTLPLSKEGKPKPIKFDGFQIRLLLKNNNWLRGVKILDSNPQTEELWKAIIHQKTKNAAKESEDKFFAKYRGNRCTHYLHVFFYHQRELHKECLELEELKTICKSFGLKSSGTKAELSNSIVIHQQRSQKWFNASIIVNYSKSNPVILNFLNSNVKQKVEFKNGKFQILFFE